MGILSKSPKPSIFAYDTSLGEDGKIRHEVMRIQQGSLGVIANCETCDEAQVMVAQANIQMADALKSPQLFGDELDQMGTRMMGLSFESYEIPGPDDGMLEGV